MFASAPNATVYKIFNVFNPNNYKLCIGWKSVENVCEGVVEVFASCGKEVNIGDVLRNLYADNDELDITKLENLMQKYWKSKGWHVDSFGMPLQTVKVIHWDYEGRQWQGNLFSPELKLKYRDIDF
jgi:hypothetical protein